MEAPILISPNWEKEFHVHTNASNMAIGAMLAQNLNSKCNQPTTYASSLLSSMEQKLHHNGMKGASHGLCLT